MTVLSVTSYTTTCPVTSTSTCSEGTVTTYTRTGTSVIYETHTKTYTFEQTTHSIPSSKSLETYMSLERHTSKSVLIMPTQVGAGPTHPLQNYGPLGGSGSEEAKPILSSTPGPSAHGDQGGEKQSSGSKSSDAEITTTKTSTRFLVQTVVAAQTTYENSVTAPPEMPSKFQANYGSETKAESAPTLAPVQHGSGQGENAPGRMMEEKPGEGAGSVHSQAPYYPVPGSNGTENGSGMVPTGIHGAGGVLGTGVPAQSSPALYANGAAIRQKGVSGIVLAGVVGIVALCIL